MGFLRCCLNIIFSPEETLICTEILQFLCKMAYFLYLGSALSVQYLAVCFTKGKVETNTYKKIERKSKTQNPGKGRRGSLSKDSASLMRFRKSPGVRIFEYSPED